MGFVLEGSTERSPLGLAPGSNESDERDKAAMQDFTLVIPTYNRPKQLRALLAYLGAEKALCRILILDSSKPRLRAANRKSAELAKLKLDYAEFPAETHNFDKFREGVHKVTTQFCALCADDDLVR